MKTNRESGFTLVELLLAMSLTVLVGGVLYLLQTTGLQTVKKGTTRLTIQSEVRRKLETMIADLQCAQEVLEITQNSIKISRFRDPRKEEDPSDISLVTVTYEIVKEEKKSILIRAEKGEQAKEIFSADHIEPEVFFPFYEDPGPEGSLSPLFLPFDFVANDTGQRQRISFIRVRMKVRQNKEFITVITSVTLRAAHNRLLQSNWKFR